MNSEHIELYRHLSETKIFKERFGYLSTYDRIICPKKDWVKVLLDCSYAAAETCNENKCTYRVHVPPVYDPEQPERCLWGMWDGKCRHSVCPEADTGIVSLYSGDRQGIYGPLDITLIKCILEQEGK